MLVTTPSTIMPPSTGNNYNAKKSILGHFDPNVTLTLDFLTSKFDAFILAQSPLVVKVWSKYVKKYPRHVCSRHTHGCTYERSGNNVKKSENTSRSRLADRQLLTFSRNTTIVCTLLVLHHHHRFCYSSQKITATSSWILQVFRSLINQNKKSELMLMRCARAYSSSRLQVILVYLYPFRRNSLFCSQNLPKKSLKPIFLGFKVINVDISKKLVASACYDKQHVCAHLQLFSC